MSRLYSVEGTLTSTGSAADHRLRLSSSQIPAFTALVGAAILKAKGADAKLVARSSSLASSALMPALDQRVCGRPG